MKKTKETKKINANKNVFAKIEDQRAPLFKEYGTVKTISNVLTVLVLICCVIGLFLVTNPDPTLSLLGWIALMVGFGVMLIFHFVSKNRFNKHTREYINFATETLNKETFNNEGFTNLEFTTNKLEVADIEKNVAYVDVYKVASRYVTYGEFDSLRFTFAEAAFVIKGEVVKKKKTGPDKTIFVGKYLDVLVPVNFKGSLLIEMSGKEMIDEPNGMAALNKIDVDGNFSVFGDKKHDYKKILGENFLNAIRKVEVKNHLLNVAISFVEGHAYVCLSYDDDVIAIPFDKPFNVKAFEQYQDNVVDVLKALHLLGKE